MRALVLFSVLLTLVRFAAAGTSSATVITVEEIHCPSCARGMMKKVQALPGVQEVRIDMDARTVTIFPQVNVMLSPRALWQTVEQTKHRPMRLQGPNGVFTSTPPE